MTAYSYRDDPAVPPFDDRRPLYVFDGTCVLCLRGAGWLMKRQRGRAIRFASAQGALGLALYAHYGLPLNDTYLLIDRGRLYTRTAGYLRVCALLGGAWRLAGVGTLVPASLRDIAYHILAANRFRWFGRAEQCALLTPDQRARLAVPIDRWPARDPA